MDVACTCQGAIVVVFRKDDEKVIKYWQPSTIKKQLYVND